MSIPWEAGDHEYWSQWCAAAFELHERVEVEHAVKTEAVKGAPSGGTFTAASPVPEWLRTMTAGRLSPPESPSLAVARFDGGRGEVDWRQTVVRGDVALSVVAAPPKAEWNDREKWIEVVDTLDRLTAEGHQVELSTEIVVNEAGQLGFDLYWVCLYGAQEESLVQRVAGDLDARSVWPPSANDPEPVTLFSWS